MGWTPPHLGILSARLKVRTTVNSEKESSHEAYAHWVDLAKNVFQIHGVDRHEQPIWRQRLPRDRWLQTVLDKIEPGCEIGMESCSGAHHWARQLQARGFQVRLIAQYFVGGGPTVAVVPDGVRQNGRRQCSHVGVIRRLGYVLGGPIDAACWRRRRTEPVAEISLTQSESLRTIAYAGFVPTLGWGSLVSVLGPIRHRRLQAFTQTVKFRLCAAICGCGSVISIMPRRMFSTCKKLSRI